MIRKFNYTDRILIRRNDIRITLQENHGGYSFNADLSKLSDYGLPTDSLVFLEAYRLSNWMRFDFGTLGAIKAPQDTCLTRFDSVEGIKFRLKVTATGDSHKLLAEVDAIPLITAKQDQEHVEPLLPVQPSKNLGDEIFRVDFSEDRPLLLINSEAGNYKDIGRSPAFLSLALPCLLREILIRILVIDGRTDDDDPEDWHCQWIRFIRQFPGIGEIPGIEADVEERMEWIQTAVATFARKQKTLAKFFEFWRDEK
jgi:hypothetical protein